MNPIKQNSRILIAALSGTAVEFYDFYVYATAAALVFGPLFFPAESASAQLLFSLMSFGLAFIARPVGAIAFGHFSHTRPSARKISELQNRLRASEAPTSRRLVMAAPSVRPMRMAPAAW